MAAGVLANVSASALGARSIKNDKGEGIVTRVRRMEDDWLACQAEATAFGLCIDPSADGSALGMAESCLYDPIIASLDVVMDGCATAEVESLCSSVTVCGWYTSCVDEWQAFANCYLMGRQCLYACSDGKAASTAATPASSPPTLADVADAPAGVEITTETPTDAAITGSPTGSPTAVEIFTESLTGSPTPASTGCTSRPVNTVVGGLIAALVVILGHD